MHRNCVNVNSEAKLTRYSFQFESYFLMFKENTPTTILTHVYFKIFVSLGYRSGIIMWIIDVNIRQYLTAGDDVDLLGHSLQVVQD